MVALRKNRLGSFSIAASSESSHDLASARSASEISRFLYRASIREVGDC
jgi:hypothetical protein